MVDVGVVIRRTWLAPTMMAASVVNTFGNWPSIIKIIGVLSIIFGVIIGLATIAGLIKLSLYMMEGQPRTMWMAQVFLDLIFILPGALSLVFGGAGYKMLQFKATKVAAPRDDTQV